jgi:hypothetical protein
MEDEIKALAEKAVKAPKSQDALRFAQAASVLQDIERTKMFMKLDVQNHAAQDSKAQPIAEGVTGNDAEAE